MRSRLPILLLLLLFAAACGGGDGGVDPPDPGGVRIRYAPDPGEVVLVIPDSVVLSVSVAPEQPFGVQFLLGDSLVHNGPSLKVMGDRVGEMRYRAIVQVGDDYYDDDWIIRVVRETDLPTPSPTAPVAAPGTAPGTVAVRWDRPPDGLLDPEVPLEGFEIAWSTVPFPPEDFEAQNITFVEDNPVGIRQNAEISGLVERETYYLRVRSLDSLDRASWPTSEVSSEATGSFELFGTVWQLDGSGWPAPVGSVVVEAGPALVTTMEDGRFQLAGLPDVEPLVLSAAEGSGLYTLPVLTTPLETVDRELDLVLVPRRNVDVLLDDGSIVQSTYRDFLLETTRNEPGQQPFDFHPWSNYPVKVWVWEYTIPDSLWQKLGASPVDVQYGDAFRTAIDLWNDGQTGEQAMLEYVPVDRDFDPLSMPGLEGVMVRLFEVPQDTSLVWPNLGQVTFERPSNGRLGETDPEVLRLSLRPIFTSQSVLDHVVAHELGHVLGLSHVTSRATLMHATSPLAQGTPTREEHFAVRYLRHGGRDMQADWIIDP